MDQEGNAKSDHIYNWGCIMRCLHQSLCVTVKHGW